MAGSWPTAVTCRSQEAQVGQWPDLEKGAADDRVLFDRAEEAAVSTRFAIVAHDEHPVGGDGARVGDGRVDAVGYGSLGQVEHTGFEVPPGTPPPGNGLILLFLRPGKAEAQ